MPDPMQIRRRNADDDGRSRAQGALATVESLPLRNLDLPNEGADDMVSLDYLHEASVLYNLRRRYFALYPTRIPGCASR